MRGSVLGFIFDPINGVQPILGIPGAATVGSPINIQTEITGLNLSFQRSYGLAITPSDSNFVIVKLTEPITIGTLGVPIGRSGRIALSPDGSAGAIYDQERKLIFVITGLPEAVTLAAEIDASSFSGAIVSMSISDGGDSVLVALSDSVVSIGKDGKVTSLDHPKHASAITFLHNSRDAVIADAISQEIYFLTGVTGSPKTTVLLSEIRDPIAVAVSNDNKHVFVASSSTGLVTGVELSGGSVTVTSCPCSPSGLTPLNGNAIFRLTEPFGSALWLFDGDSPRPRTVFVPPYKRPTNEEPAP